MSLTKMIQPSRNTLSNGNNNQLKSNAQTGLQQTSTASGNSYMKAANNPAKMSQEDSIKEMLGYYTNNSNSVLSGASNSALNQYSQVKNDTAKSKQESYVASELAKKNSQISLKNMGLGNTGLAETTQTNILSDYLNNVNKASSTSTDNVSNILKQYYSTVNPELEAQTIKKQDESFNLAQTELNTINDMSQLDEVLKKYEGNVSDYQYNQLKMAVLNTKSDYYLTQKKVDPIQQNAQGDAIDVNNYDLEGILAEGNWVGGQQKDSNQYNLVKDILENAKAGKYKDGYVTDFDYGLGKAKYVLYQGKFYKV